MNAPTAARETARRAARFNLWAGVFVMAMLAVFAVKAAVDNRHLPTRHFEAAPAREAPVDHWWSVAVEKP